MALLHQTHLVINMRSVLNFRDRSWLWASFGLQLEIVLIISLIEASFKAS